MENRWSHFVVLGEKPKSGIIKLKKKYASLWWSHYNGYTRIGIFSGIESNEIKEDLDAAFEGYAVCEIENPDFKNPELTPETVEDLNQIKLCVCNTIAREFNYEIPETKLAPHYLNYWVHLFFNSLGATYYQEAKILAWNVQKALELS